MTEEIHQQAGKPGTRAASGVKYAGLMADTGPAGVGRIKCHKSHRQIDTQGYQPDHRTFTRALCCLAAKTQLLLCRFLW